MTIFPSSVSIEGWSSLARCKDDKAKQTPSYRQPTLICSIWFVSPHFAKHYSASEKETDAWGGRVLLVCSWRARAPNNCQDQRFVVQSNANSRYTRWLQMADHNGNSHKKRKRRRRRRWGREKGKGRGYISRARKEKTYTRRLVVNSGDDTGVRCTVQVSTCTARDGAGRVCRQGGQDGHSKEGSHGCGFLEDY